MRRLAGLWLAAVSLSVQAAGVPTVQVQCALAEARYKFGVSTSQVAAAEADCSGQLAELLGNRIRFVRFESQAAHDTKLTVRIGKSAAEADPMELRPVEMEIQLTGSDLPEPPKPVYWPYRELQDWLSVPRIDVFADDVAARFAAELGDREAQLVETQLSRLVIADDAFVMPNDMSWLLPFSRDELKLGDDTELKIKASLTRQGSQERFLYTVTLFGDFATAADVPAEFHNKVKALHLRDDKLEQLPSIERVKSADTIDVIYVVVNRYVPPLEALSTSPSQLLQN